MENRQKRTTVAVIGTQGVPAQYGGFETLVDNLLDFNNDEKFHYVVYCSSISYPEKTKFYKNASLVYLPLKAQGIQSLIYDFTSLLDATRKYDVVLALGTSGAFVLPFLVNKSRRKVIFNIDGLEHRRHKWNFVTRKLLLILERIAIRYASFIIADNKVIRDYVLKTYGKLPYLIEYGGDHALVGRRQELNNHYFSVCRIEPENNVHLILEAFSRMPEEKVVLVGNWDSSGYGRTLKQQYAVCNNIKIINPIYDLNRLNELRTTCSWYLHGHSAGGTNPSLVEAMNLGLNIICFDVDFNRETTMHNAVYFKNADNLIALVRQVRSGLIAGNGKAMKGIALERYLWQVISRKYLDLFSQVVQQNSKTASAEQ